MIASAHEAIPGSDREGSELDGPQYDVIIVGAGIAGSSMAIALGQRGHSVLLLDKASFPRHKPCGEGLMPEGVAILERFGLAESVLARGARRFRGMRYRSVAGVWAEAEFPVAAGIPAHGFVLQRRELDQVLFEGAKEQENVDVQDGFHVSSLRMQGDKVVGVTGHAAGSMAADVSFRGKLTIGADGIHSIFHRACRLNRTLCRRRRFGITGHFSGLRDVGDYVEVLMEPEGEIYVAQGPGDLTLVALLLEAREMRRFKDGREAAYEAFVRAAPGLAERVVGAEIVPPVSAVGPLGFTVERCFGPGFILIGDAAGFLDPISGMGMTLALKSVEVAAPIVERAMATGDVSAAALAPYGRRRSEAVEDAVRLTRLLLLMARHKGIANRAVRRLSRDRNLFTKLLGLVTGHTRYRDIRLRERLALLSG